MIGKYTLPAMDGEGNAKIYPNLTTQNLIFNIHPNPIASMVTNGIFYPLIYHSKIHHLYVPAPSKEGAN